MRYYAGIGSRETPPEVLELMTSVARALQAAGWRLRSGGADGADSAFAQGAGPDADIYLPWPGFNNVNDGIACGDVPWMRAIAETFHPAWGSCKRGARALHTRNVAQVLGHVIDGPRSEMVICWTRNGSGQGGTGQAIRIARHYGVPVFDLAIPADRDLLLTNLEELA